MFTLSEQQIDFISEDLLARGIELEALHQNLLDHVCCLLEVEMQSDSDFTSCYESVIRRFYKQELWELEEETYLLLTYKNYYQMKRSTYIAGALSLILLTTGLIFKWFFLPGAAFFIVSGISMASLLFMPLMLLLKLRNASTRDKLVNSAGLLTSMVLSMSILFKVQHYPGADMLFNIGGGLLVIVFIPLYFFFGIRIPEQRNNTITVTILMILGCGLFMTLMRTPKVQEMKALNATRIYLQGERLLQNERQMQEKQGQTNNGLHARIYRRCAELKSYILRQETGSDQLQADFEDRKQYIKDIPAMAHFENMPQFRDMQELGKDMDQYNRENRSGNLYDSMQLQELFRMERTVTILNLLTQTQLQMLQDQKLLASNR